MNGVVTVLGTVSFTLRRNTWYDLRLDAVGNELRGFINGAQVLQAVDSSPPVAKAQSSPTGGSQYVNYLAWQP